VCAFTAIWWHNSKKQSKYSGLSGKGRLLNQPPTGFTCGTCGQFHQGLPLDIAFTAPIYWHQIPEAERHNRAELTPDFCSIDNKDFFVRGLISIPILETDQFFMWGVWASLSDKNYCRMIELWHDPKIVDEPSYFGWLANKLPGYPDTLNLKSNVQSEDVESRPFITLELTDHPLALEQRNGITYARVQELAALTSH
jgi:hypothetical protein